MKSIKRIIILISLFFMSFITTGCQFTEDMKMMYDSKRIYVMATDSELIPNSFEVENDIDLLFTLAERDIMYYYAFADGVPLAKQYSATANLGYNLAYMLNTPAKLIQNIRYDFKFKEEVSDIDEETADKLDIAINKTLSETSLWYFIIMDIIYAIFGFICASFMLFFGTLFGFLNHPINTFLDIPTVLYGIVTSAILAIKYIFKLWN